MKKIIEDKEKVIKMLTVINSKDEKYKFNEKEIQLILMWAYGYMDLSRCGYLPIDLDIKDNMDIYNFKRKLEQCLDGEYKIYERNIRG